MTATEDKFLIVLLLAAILFIVTISAAFAGGQRCRSHKVGSTTYLTCENPEKRCRSYTMGSTTYTRCDR